jgi:hypothetical protein
MQTNKTLERPSSVNLALYMLYTSLGIAAVIVLLVWYLWGFPGPAASFLVSYILLIAFYRVEGAWWLIHMDLVIVPFAIWLYYMIAKGKHWARTLVLFGVILAILDSIIAKPLTLSFPAQEGSKLSYHMPYFLIGANIVQAVIKIAAMALLFGRVSSDWFSAMSARNCKD